MAARFNSKKKNLRKGKVEKTKQVKKTQKAWTVPAQRTKKQNKVDRKIR